MDCRRSTFTDKFQSPPDRGWCSSPARSPAPRTVGGWQRRPRRPGRAVLSQPRGRAGRGWRHLRRRCEVDRVPRRLDAGQDAAVGRGRCRGVREIGHYDDASTHRHRRRRTGRARSPRRSRSDRRRRLAQMSLGRQERQPMRRHGQRRPWIPETDASVLDGLVDHPGDTAEAARIAVAPRHGDVAEAQS